MGAAASPGMSDAAAGNELESPPGGSEANANSDAASSGLEISPLVRRAAVAELSRPLDGSDIQPAEAHTEVARLRRLLANPESELQNGDVVIRYQMYDEKFPVVDGCLSVAKLDEDYCLSDVMPGCKLELVTCPLAKKYELEAANEEVPYVKQSDDGSKFVGMNTLEEYWVVVYENEEQRKKDMAKVRARIEADGIAKKEGPRAVGCSCIEGNPCTEGNKYNCKNWEMRFAIAKEHGWKGH